MSGQIVSKRYADALFQLAKEKGNIEQITEDLRVARQVFQENKQLNAFLTHPQVNENDKKQFLTTVFVNAETDVLNTLKILAERKRITIIPEVTDEFIHLVNEEKGIAEATVYSVRELNKEEKQKLEKSFANRMNKQAIRVKNEVDPQILGGIKIRIGNTIYDGSVRGKLGRIERDIAAI